MQTASMTHRRHADTFLTHIFGGGLADERYRVERYRSAASGEIKPLVEGQAKGGRRQKRQIMSLRTVRRLRPARDEIIIATGISVDGGIQYWGEWSCGLFANGRHR